MFTKNSLVRSMLIGISLVVTCAISAVAGWNGNIADALSNGYVDRPVMRVAAVAGQVVISEFRVRGPSGPDDEYVEIYNNTSTPMTVTTTDASAGWAVVAEDGAARFIIPNGVIIPARGHYLGTNSVAYGLGTYALGDITFTTDIPDNSGIALFNSAVTFDLTTRLDAVGFTSSPALYREGTGLATLVPFSIDAGFTRDLDGPTFTPTLQDTDNNTTDFVYVDTNGTFNGGQQHLGAPGPENLAGPIHDPNGSMGSTPLDPFVSAGSSPNFVYDPTSDPGNNSSFGTILLRRTFTNNTGAPITRLRFRFVDISTFPAPPNVADLRPRNAAGGVVAIAGPNPACPGNLCTVVATTLEQPPNQFNGGGINSSWSVDSITGGAPLANGASVNVALLSGIEQSGCYRLEIQTESLPGTGRTILFRGSAGSLGACPGDPATTTAARVSLAGRVMTAGGRGIRGETVTVSGGGLMAPQSSLTSSFGFYIFENLVAGQTYIVSVGSKRYTYNVPSRLVNLVDAVADADFVAEEQK